MVDGNLIGTDTSGQGSLPNGVGVLLAGGASSNTIGGTTRASGNTIAHNLQPGVVVEGNTSVGDAITANLIYDNNSQAATTLAQGIDLGDDGNTPNSAAPRQGPDELQNTPVIVATPQGFLGWLAGSLPETTYLIDVYAGPAYTRDGSSQAQQFLGSLLTTTDSSGQATFVVPFATPANLPLVTATATDPAGNTSELSAQRSSLGLVLPAAIVRDAPDTPFVFSTAGGTAITLADPSAGPLDPTVAISLSVTAGTLRLSSSAGLSGTGDGSGSLEFSGPITAVNAALEGLTYVPATGYLGDVVLSSSASEYESQPVQAQLTIHDGYFVVTSTTDSGLGSLRQALSRHREQPGANTIDFAISGSGVHTIMLDSPLPDIVGPVLVDGFSQPGYAGTPLIELEPAGAAVTNGLTITGSVRRSVGFPWAASAWGRGFSLPVPEPPATRSPQTRSVPTRPGPCRCPT